MLELLERQKSLTVNQWKIISAAILGDMLDFFDFFLIGYALAFIVGQWKLTFLESGTILLAAGIGAIPGAFFWGWMADRIGRRKVFVATVLNFSPATGLMAASPDQYCWLFLAFCRMLVGIGVAGMVTVDLPLVQEFVPSSKRGFVGRHRHLDHFRGRRAGRRGGRLSRTDHRLAWTISDRLGAGADDADDPRLGPGIAEMADAYGSARRGAKIARLGLAGRSERDRTAQRSSRGAKDLVAGAVQLSAQRGGHGAHQSRLADRRQWDRAMGADPARVAAENPAG